MYTLITKAGVGTYLKTYQATTEVPEASEAHWEDHPNNNMNDYWATVSTANDTEVSIYSAEQYGGTSLTIPSNQTSFDVEKGGFKDKVASFKVFKV